MTDSAFMVRLVPARRLVWLAGGVLVPLALVAGPAGHPAAFPAAALLIGLVAVWDAVRGRRGMRDLACSLSPSVAASAGATAELELTIQQDGTRARRVRVGLGLPAGLGPDRIVVPVELPTSGRLRVAIPFDAVTRGRHRVDGVQVEAESPWRCWEVRRRFASECEVRVYPNLLRERRAAATLFLARGHAGHMAVRQVGRGREFEKLRDYMPGDAMGDVHWRATARRARLATKEFQVERTQEVYVILDQSRLSARPAGPGLTVLDRGVNTALLLALAAQRQGDLFGLVLFGDRVRRLVRARGGRGHYNTCRDAIYTSAPLLVEPDFDELCSVLQLRLRRRALLVFLTSLDNPSLADSFERNIDRLAQRHHIVVPMLRPAEAQPLFSGDAVGTEDEVCSRLAGHLLWHDLAELRGRLARAGVQLRLLENEALALETLRQYSETKARQLV